MATTLDSSEKGTAFAISGSLQTISTTSATNERPHQAGFKPAIGSERVLTGIGLSEGTAIGWPCFYRIPESSLRSTPGSAADEAERARRAVREVADYYTDLAQQADSRLSREAGDIFRAQAMLANDPTLITTLERILAAGGITAEAAVVATFNQFGSELQAATSGVIRERVCDIDELKNSVLTCLGNGCAYLNCEDSCFCRPGECRNGRDHILIATQFMPGAAISTGPYTRGFVVEKGGPSSHAAILARMMGLPAVSGIPHVAEVLSTGRQLLIDGDAGKVYIDPSPETLEYYKDQQGRRGGTYTAVVPPVKGFGILADLERTDDIALALAVQAEGIGLYRSETEVLLKRRILSEDEQTERYSRLLDNFPGPVYVRLLDLGADKAADWLDLPAEDNPALGCRGARLLLAQPALLQTQARALARASQKREIKVLYPMVHSVRQFLKLREIFDAAISDIPNARLSHGVMFEVPSACLEAPAFFDHVDFGRIGTNDLTQYLYATDRMSGVIEQDELFEQPALWTLIETVSRAAAAAGKPLSLCGELAASPKFIGRILRAGIAEISVCPRYIATLREAARGILEGSASDWYSASSQEA